MNLNTGPVSTSAYNSPGRASIPGATYTKGPVDKPPIVGGLHMQTHTIEYMGEDNMWAGVMFLFILGGLVRLLFGHWLMGGFILLFATLFLMSTYYAKRPRIKHGLSKVLCAAFYKTFRNKSKPGQYVRFRRMGVTVTVSILCFLLFFL